MTFSKIKYPSLVSFQFIVFNYNQYIWRTTADFHTNPSKVPSLIPSCFLLRTKECHTLLQAELLGDSVSGGEEVATTSTTRAHSQAHKWLSPFPETLLPFTLQRLCYLCSVISVPREEDSFVL